MSEQTDDASEVLTAAIDNFTAHHPKDACADCLTPIYQAGVLDGAQELAREILGLHRPWYEINGVRHDNVVMAYFDDDTVPQDHRCITEGPERCDADEHYALACVECRAIIADGDMEGSLLWPCPTAQLVTGPKALLVTEQVKP